MKCQLVLFSIFKEFCGCHCNVRSQCKLKQVCSQCQSYVKSVHAQRSFAHMCNILKLYVCNADRVNWKGTGNLECN